MNEDIEVGSFWHEKQEDSTIGIVHVYEVSSEMIDYWMNGERCGCSPDVFLSTFERFESIGSELKALIEAVRLVRKSLDEYDSTEGGGEIQYAEIMHEPIDLLIDALKEYEATND